MFFSNSYVLSLEEPAILRLQRDSSFYRELVATVHLAARVYCFHLW